MVSFALGRLETLTGRETDILGELIDCPGNDDIARRLGITERTVKFHMVNLRNKLGDLSRFQLCLVALLAPSLAAARPVTNSGDLMGAGKLTPGIRELFPT